MEKSEIANKELLLDEIIAHLRHFVHLYGIESLFIVGGYCRALYLGRRWEVNDIDVASAYHDQAVQLGGLFASEILNTSPEFYHRTGTAHIEYRSQLGTINIEFQGNSTNAYMHSQEVKDYLHEKGVEDVPLMNNLYGRDFTMNAMILTLKDGHLLDPLGRAQADLDKSLIAPILPAELLIKYNPLAILRAVRFSVSYDFFIDPQLRAQMKQNVELLPKTISHERIVKEMVRILKANPQKAIEAFEDFGLTSILLDKEVKSLLRLEVMNA